MTATSEIDPTATGFEAGSQRLVGPTAPPFDREMQAVFDEFWRPLVMPEGKWDMAQVVRELYDYKLLLDEVPKVYDHVTWGRISKPNTLASEVIAAHNDICHSDCGEPA